jgi:glucokinase
MNMILAGDVGGTKTLLEVGTMVDGRWQPAFGARYATADHPSLDHLLQRFFQDWHSTGRARDPVTHACFGVAGPMFDNCVQMTNLQWIVDGQSISAAFNIPSVRVINDFAAAASGVEKLQDADLVVLQAGEPLAAAPRLVIGAGTGLGVAYLIRGESGYQVIAGEGGHTAFAPTTLEQMALWRDLHTRQGRVTIEDVVSGTGLVRIYEFIERTQGGGAARTEITPAAITEAAFQSGHPTCLRALDLFIACYGEAAGNYALAALARGGVYVAGGIAPCIMSRLLAGGFLDAFNAKGVYGDTIRKIPVSVVTNERLGLLGSALIAARGQGDQTSVDSRLAL